MVDNQIFLPGSSYPFELFPHVIRSINSKDIYISRYVGFPVGSKIDRKTCTSKPIIFLHGNQTNLADFKKVFEYFVDKDLAIYAPEYPGYNPKHGGKRSEEGIHLATQAAYEQALDDGWLPSEIVIVGYSLGSIGGCHLVQNKPVGKLVLISAFTSITKVGVDLGYPLFLISKAIHPNKLNNLNKIKLFTGVLVVIHGYKDTFIQPVHSQELFDTCPSTDKRMFLIDEKHDISNWDSIIPHFYIV